MCWGAAAKGKERRENLESQTVTTLRSDELTYKLRFPKRPVTPNLTEFRSPTGFALEPRTKIRQEALDAKDPFRKAAHHVTPFSSATPPLPLPDAGAPQPNPLPLE